MKTAHRLAIVFAAACLNLGLSSAPAPEQESKAGAQAKAVAEAKAKRNAQILKNFATNFTLYDRSGKRVAQFGERALYEQTVFSPDRTRLAVIKDDLENESADLWILDLAGGGVTRMTTSAKNDFVQAPVWSPDGSQLAYVAMRGGQESIFLRASNGRGPEELVYKNPGAFLELTDWSLDGLFLAFAKSDLSGGVLYVLSLKGDSERQPREISRSYKQLFGPRFSPDGRYLSYMEMDRANRKEVFVRPVEATPGVEPWQISEGSRSTAFWRRDGKELYYVGLDRSVMVADVRSSPTFAFTKPKAIFRPPGTVPDDIAAVSADGERFLALPPPRGPELQQITVFDREGKVLRKVAQPGLYSQPAFSPDVTRLAVMKEDLTSGRQDIWVIEIATGKTLRLTNDTLFKLFPKWSPDGTHVFYVSERKGDWGVYRRAADGTGDEELLFRNEPGAFVDLTDISPDGKFLVCGSGGVILVVPLTGTDPLARKPIEYLREEFNDVMGRLSPDGRFIAFQSDVAQAERGEVYVQLYDASAAAASDAKWRVSQDGAGGNNGFMFSGMLSWREDGKELLFRGLDLDTNELLMMAVDVDTSSTFHSGTPKLLFKLPGPIDDNLGNISRDGQQFVFAINVPAGTNER